MKINKIIATCLAMAVTIPACTAVAAAAKENPLLPYKEVIDNFNETYDTNYHLLMEEKDLLPGCTMEDAVNSICEMTTDEFENFLYESYSSKEETISPRTITTKTTQKAYYSTNNYLYMTTYWVSVDGYNHYSSIVDGDSGYDGTMQFPYYDTYGFSYELRNSNQEVYCVYQCRRYEKEGAYIDGYQFEVTYQAEQGNKWL